MNENKSNEAGKSLKFDKRWIFLGIIVVAILGILSVPLWLKPEEVPAETTVPTTQPPTTQPPTTQPPTTQPTEPPTEPTTEPTEPTMIPEMEELYVKNPDFSSWLTIGDTIIDYAVMFTPEDEEKYIYSNFDGEYDWNGSLFISEDCSFDPETQNILVYGHNKVSGGMFHDLLEYENEKYWEKHRYINFKTLYEDRIYEVFAAFDDKIYLKEEDVFKFYNFIDPQTEEEFNEGIAYFKEKTPYDTGIDVEYGDRLLTLITCSYRGKTGRYVVIGRLLTPEEVDALQIDQTNIPVPAETTAG